MESPFGEKENGENRNTLNFASIEYMIDTGSITQSLGWMILGHMVCKRNAAAAAKSLQSCPTLCDPIDGSPPGSPVPGILQARILEWLVIFFSRGSCSLRDQTGVSCIGKQIFFFNHQTTSY